MKKSTIRRLLVLCLCLTLVTVSLIGGTLAKYTTSGNASATATVATWVPTITVNSVDAVTTHSFTIPGDTLHPGSTATIPVKVVNNSDTVDAEAIVTITITGAPTNMTFTYGGQTFTSGTAMSAYTVTKGTEGVSKDLVLTWAFEGTATDDNDFAGKSFTVKVDVTLNQTTNDLTTGN